VSGTDPRIARERAAATANQWPTGAPTTAEAMTSFWRYIARGLEHLVQLASDSARAPSDGLAADLGLGQPCGQRVMPLRS